jgi:hypothetical protein
MQPSPFPIVLILAFASLPPLIAFLIIFHILLGVSTIHLIDLSFLHLFSSFSSFFLEPGGIRFILALFLLYLHECLLVAFVIIYLVDLQALHRDNSMAKTISPLYF